MVAVNRPASIPVVVSAQHAGDKSGILIFDLGDVRRAST